MKASRVTALGAGMALPAIGVLVRYRRDMNAASARLAAVDRHLVSTQWGAVEYAERGRGEPVQAPGGSHAAHTLRDSHDRGAVLASDSTVDEPLGRNAVRPDTRDDWR